MIKLTDGQRTTLASKESLNTNNIAKGALAINLGTSIHHPGDNMFYRTDSPDLLSRQRLEPISIFESFGWTNKRHSPPATSYKPLTTPSCDNPSTNFSLPHPQLFRRRPRPQLFSAARPTLTSHSVRPRPHPHPPLLRHYPTFPHSQGPCSICPLRCAAVRDYRVPSLPL